MLVSPAAAQVKPDFDPDYAWNTIRAEYGALIPAGTVSNKSLGLMSLSYTRRYSGRWGWRTGVQYASLDARSITTSDSPFLPFIGFGQNLSTAVFRGLWNISGTIFPGIMAVIPRIMRNRE